MQRVRMHRSTFVALALCAFGYLYVSPYFPALNNPNENVRLYMTAAIVEEGTYRIDDVRRRWGWTNDGACVDRAPDGTYGACETHPPPPGTSRHFYSVKAPGASLLGVLPYALYRAIAGERFDRTTALHVVRLVATVLPTLLFLAFLHRFLLRSTRTRALAHATLFAYALGSMMYGYGLLFLSHVQSAACAFGAYALLEAAGRRGRITGRKAFFAGLLATATTALEYPCFFLTVLLCARALVSVRPLHRLVPFAMGALVPTAAVMHFQSSAFGSPLRPGHLFVETPEFRSIHEQGFFGADMVHWDAAVRLLVDPRLGAFATTPLLALAPLGALVLLRRRPREAVFVVAMILALYVPVVFLSNWDGGWVVGPRYLAAVVPFAAVLAAVGLDSLALRERTLAIAVAAGLMLASFLAGGAVSALYPHVPPDVTRPLTELVAPLVRHGFAPRTLANLFSVYGRASLLPLGLLAVAAFAVVVLAGTRRTGRVRLRIALAIPFLALGLYPSQPWELPTQGSRIALAQVTRTWDPAGHDDVSLAIARAREGTLDPEDARRARVALDRLGRSRERVLLTPGSAPHR